MSSELGSERKYYTVSANLWFLGFQKMVDQVIIGIITWFHIVSVIGWLGAALTFLVSVRPTLAKLSPQTGSELLPKMLPRFVRTVQVFSVLTVVFGPLLATAMSMNGPPNQFDLISPWSIFVTCGAALGITTLLVVFLLFTPTATKLVRLIRQMQQNPPQAPPPEMPKLQKRMAIIPPLGVSLLLLAEVFMVTAAQF